METAVLHRSNFSPATAPTFTKSTADIEWALFDTRVDLLKFAPSTSTTAYCKTSNSHDVFASLHLAVPPESSLVQLYTDDEVSEKPVVVAADADLLLIHMVVAVKGHNLFVYKPHTDWPCMKLLPPPIDWTGRPKATGIARIGKGFVVANFGTQIVFDSMSERGVEVAVLWLYRSGAKMWETKQLEMPYAPEEGMIEAPWFGDTVFSFDGFICWADYHRGIVYCNVFSSEPQLCFIRFPGIEKWSGDRDFPSAYRTVSVCGDNIKFVNVDNGKFRNNDDNDTVSIESDDGGSAEMEDSECLITTWSLKIPEFEWENDDTSLQLKELWSLPKYQDAHLPKIVPKFPIFSMQDRDVLYFMIIPSFLDRSSVITVDMKNRSIRPPMIYKNPIKGETSSFDATNVFLLIPMVCSELVRYLKYPAGYL